MPKPIRDAGMVMVETQPVCRPKYMLEKQITRPTARPTMTPRGVKLWPVMVGDEVGDAEPGFREEEDEDEEGGRRGRVSLSVSF
jgi:hypothetical protein